jgi:hypothetical protein
VIWGITKRTGQKYVEGGRFLVLGDRARLGRGAEGGDWVGVVEQ